VDLKGKLCDSSSDYTCFQKHRLFGFFGWVTCYMYWKPMPSILILVGNLGFGFHRGLLYFPSALRIKMITYVKITCWANPWGVASYWRSGFVSNQKTIFITHYDSFQLLTFRQRNFLHAFSFSSILIQTFLRCTESVLCEQYYRYISKLQWPRLERGLLKGVLCIEQSTQN
jgi:hypothetical protein